MADHTANAEEALRCFKKKAPDTPSLFQSGKLVLQNYHIGWIITGVFTLIACGVSFWLVNKHLINYSKKHEQRYIIRILFMVPIYALVSFASFLFWNHATLLILVRDCYESTVLTAFFYLLLLYVSPTSEGQRQIFLQAGLSREAEEEAQKRGEMPKKWIFPLGSVKWKPQDGLYFLQLMKWGVLQYCVIRPGTTLAAVILEYLGLYCEESWGFGWGHVYIVVTVSISVSVAMYCLIQLYIPVSSLLLPHRPLLKLFAIKAVVFLTFWQATFLSGLSLVGIVKPTKYMTAADVNIGIGAILETIEMSLFAILHIRAFSYKPYIVLPTSEYPFSTHTSRLRSLGHAFDFRETLKEVWRGVIYMGYKFKKKEVPEDIRPRRAQAYGVVFGKDREPASYLTLLVEEKQKRHSTEYLHPDDEKALPTLPVIDEAQLHSEPTPRRQSRDWLGGDRKYTRREMTELGVQIERELEKRGLTGYPRGSLQEALPDHSMASSVPHIRHPTWWHRIYDRLSEHNSPQRITQSPTQLRGEDYYPVNLDELPPSQLLSVGSHRDRYPRVLAPEIPTHGPSFDVSESRTKNSLSPHEGSRPVLDSRIPQLQPRSLQRQTRIERTRRIHRRESAFSPHDYDIDKPSS